jgi:hypothetical protein
MDSFVNLGIYMIFNLQFFLNLGWCKIGMYTVETVPQILNFVLFPGMWYARRDSLTMQASRTSQSLTESWL